MLFVFLNAGIGPHQSALADAMYDELGDNFVFIEFGRSKRQHGSYEGATKGIDYHSNRPYILQMYKSKENEERARHLLDKADVLRVGGEPLKLIKNRLKQKKLTFRSSERLFKTPIWQHTPITFMHIYDRLMKYANPNYRLLCQSAYLPNDVKFFRSYKDRCYKFAYFTEVGKLDIEKSLLERRRDKLQIIWCARFINWKHPELPVLLAKSLIQSGRDNFEIKMIGANTTPLWKKIQKIIFKKKLQQYIQLTGGITNVEVLRTMQRSNVFLFTSDRNEGWGAVLNEAMSAGCACVASNEIGAVPYLIKHDENGLIFKSKSLQSLFDQVSKLYDDRQYCENLGRNAYKTITTEWSAQTAARRLIELSKSIINGKEIFISNGPCSKAFPINS